MPRNYKFHAIALSAICGLIIVLYIIMMPKRPTVVTDDGGLNDRFIQIDSATWGDTCNPYITKELQERQFKPAPRDAKGNLIEQKPLELVSSNNVLTFVSAACDGKLHCEILATSSSLGVEPLPSCYKRLKVGYRCFNYDQLQLTDIGQSETLKINCDEAAKPASK